jgi:hypothetical protein
MKNFIMVILILFFISLNLGAYKINYFFDFENGIAKNTYNTIRIPGNTGTKFSAKNDLNQKSTHFYRLKFGLNFLKRHNVFFLIAPLNIKASGISSKNINFNNVSFPKQSNLNLFYRFDSYRFTYRYDFFISQNLIIGTGLTGKIRDASIKLENSSLSSEKKNTGFVPLINFYLSYNLYKNLFLNFDFDALAAPQGRAEDIQISLNYKVNKNLTLRTGYRFLEGGANNDEVYNFTAIHYFLFGFKLDYFR